MLSDAQKVARGGKASCGLAHEGYVYCWGDWNGTRRMPFLAFGTRRMKDVETDGASYFCAAREADGVVQCVGRKYSVMLAPLRANGSFGDAYVAWLTPDGEVITVYVRAPAAGMTFTVG